MLKEVGRFGVVLLLACSASPKPVPPRLRAELLALAITEIHYHPLDEGPVSGDEFEFVELKNTGEAPLTLDDIGFDEGIDYVVPNGTGLAPGEFLVVASNANAFRDRYGFAASGEYAGALADAGERITLSDLASGAAIVSLAYSDAAPWPAGADRDGRSLVPIIADLRDDPDRPFHWRSSFAKHGSPVKDDPGVAYVNEILAHTDEPLKDSIELFNPNDTPLDVSGWFLTDNKSKPAKYRIALGTIVPARGFAVFDADDFNADPDAPLNFLLSEHGSDVYVVADERGCAIAFCDGFTFTDQENGSAFGRHRLASGELQLANLATPTLGSENAPPAVGPLVITEIMYNPPPGGAEYVELQNISTAAVQLWEPSGTRPDHTWRIDGIGFAFPPSTTLAPGETLLVIPYSVAESAFRETYGVPADVRIFTMSESRADYGEVLTLRKAAKPYGDDVQPTLPFYLVETVAFGNTTPWPVAANGNGSALHRKDLRAYGNDPTNWEAGPPTPGRDSR
jgi:hypothetical protein